MKTNSATRSWVLCTVCTVGLLLVLNVASFFLCSSPHQIQRLLQSKEEEEEDVKESRVNRLVMLATNSTPSTLDSSLFLGFEVCGGGLFTYEGTGEGSSDEHLALQKLSLMHGLALASVTYLHYIIWPLHSLKL